MSYQNISAFMQGQGFTLVTRQRDLIAITGQRELPQSLSFPLFVKMAGDEMELVSLHHEVGASNYMAFSLSGALCDFVGFRLDNQGRCVAYDTAKYPDFDPALLAIARAAEQDIQARVIALLEHNKEFLQIERWALLQRSIKGEDEWKLDKIVGQTITNGFSRNIPSFKVRG